MTRKGKKRPPAIAAWLLDRIFPPNEFDTARGDFDEMYFYGLENHGKFKAWLFYWGHLLVSIGSYLGKAILGRIGMSRNYLRIAFRNLQKQKLYSFINIAGLSLGMASCIIILMFVNDELSYDNFFANRENIYRVVTASESGGIIRTRATAPGPAGVELPDLLNEIEFSTRFIELADWHEQFLISYEDDVFEDSDVFAADENFFKVLSFEFVAGSPLTSLTNPKSVVLTEEMALKVFGGRDALGKIISVGRYSGLTVTGVIKNIPRNSHFKFNFIISFVTLPAFMQNTYNRWTGLDTYTYITLSPGIDPGSVEAQIAPIVDDRANKELRGDGLRYDLRLQKLGDIYLRSRLDKELEENGSILHVYLFSTIALFILLVACINFINLATARSFRRGKEVGIRKVFGAYKKQLIFQFLNESLLTSFISLVGAMVLVLVFLPYFNMLAYKELTLGAFFNVWTILGLFLLLCIAGIFAGSYPAFFLSSFQPVQALRKTISAKSLAVVLRKGLVVLQFAISIILIFGTITIAEQISFMKEKNLGFNKDQVLIVRTKKGVSEDQYPEIKNRLKSHHAVLEATFSSSVPGREGARQLFREKNDNTGSNVFDAIFTDNDFLKTYGIPLVAGKAFSEALSSDHQETLLLNETAAQMLNLHKRVIGMEFEMGTWLNGKVIGIIKDFHNNPLKQRIRPVVLSVHHTWGKAYLSLKISGDNVSDTIQFIKDEWKTIEPNRELDYFFLDEDFDRQYRSEERLSSLFSYFAFIAICIASLGLIGLTSFSTEQRSKEIGIRKVLGSSSSAIVILFNREFFKLAVVSNIIALPIAYLLMSKWLQEFAYKITIGHETLVAAGGLVLVFAILTVSLQVIRAATSNPVISLKHE